MSSEDAPSGAGGDPSPRREIVPVLTQHTPRYTRVRVAEQARPPPQHLPAAAHGTPSVRDDYFSHLLQQKKLREAELKRLEEKPI